MVLPPMQCNFQFRQKAVDIFQENRYNNRANPASVAQSVVHLTRNEKVACSSHVTSSKKAQPHRGWAFLDRDVIRTLKCNSPVDCCLIPARRDQHHNFASNREAKCKRVTSLSASPIGVALFGAKEGTGLV